MKIAKTINKTKCSTSSFCHPIPRTLARVLASTLAAFASLSFLPLVGYPLFLLWQLECHDGVLLSLPSPR